MTLLSLVAGAPNQYPQYPAHAWGLGAKMLQMHGKRFGRARSPQGEMAGIFDCSSAPTSPYLFPYPATRTAGETYLLEVALRLPSPFPPFFSCSPPVHSTQVWCLSNIPEEAPTRVWLLQYLSTDLTSGIYQAFSKPDLMWAVYSYFSWCVHSR